MTITAEDRLLEDGIIDSQGMLNLIMHIEENYGLTIDDTDVDLDNFGSVESIVRYIVAKQAE